MSYDIELRVPVKGTDNLAVAIPFTEANITWNVGEMIRKSTGLEWRNEEDNGTLREFIKGIKKGEAELSAFPEKYKQYESPNGWGTVEGCLRFFRWIIKDYETFVWWNDERLHDYAQVWIV